MSENTSRVGAVLGMVSDYVRRMATLLSDGLGLVEVLNEMTDRISQQLGETDHTEVGRLYLYSRWIETHRAYFDSVSLLRDNFLEKCHEFYELERDDWRLDSLGLEKDESLEIKQALTGLEIEVEELASRVRGCYQDFFPPSYKQLCRDYDVEPVEDDTFNA